MRISAPVCTVLAPSPLFLIYLGLAQVFMLSADQELDEGTLQSILHSGHSRIPIHKPGHRCVSVC